MPAPIGHITHHERPRPANMTMLTAGERLCCHNGALFQVTERMVAVMDPLDHDLSIAEAWGCRLTFTEISECLVGFYAPHKLRPVLIALDEDRRRRGRGPLTSQVIGW